MTKDEILQHLIEMVKDREAVAFSRTELAGFVLFVLEREIGMLSDDSVNALFIVATGLMRDHVDAVEQDILAVRRLLGSK